jgi:putative thioredoxin
MHHRLTAGQHACEVPVVVLLWSPRSEACVALLDVLGGLAAADKGKWSLATVNVDAVPRVGAMFGVEAVPTVVALAAGQPIARVLERNATTSYDPYNFL